VVRFTIDTPLGRHGFRPRRLDCAMPVGPGLLMLASKRDGVKYVAIDAGILVKTDRTVRIAVRHALVGPALGDFRAECTRELAAWQERDRQLRTTLARLESDLVRRLADLSKPYNV